MGIREGTEKREVRRQERKELESWEEWEREIPEKDWKGIKGSVCVIKQVYTFS